MESINQKDIWYANLNPSKGNEQAGLRPVVIVSGNLLNEHLNLVWVVPLTSKIKSFKGNPILDPNSTNNLSETSEMLVFHLRSISKIRLVKKVGQITEDQFQLAKKTIDDIIRL